MRGHTEILRARLGKKAPAIVFVNDWPCKTTDWARHGDHATVCTHGDPLSSLDLRFLVGLRVSISADDEARAKALFGLAVAAGAKVVVANCVQPDRHEFAQAGWCEIYQKEALSG